MLLRSFIPGRGRWQIDALEGRPGLVERLDKLLVTRPGIQEAKSSALTARILVRFTTTLDAEAVERIIRQCLAEARLQPPRPATPPRQARKASSMLAPLERLAKQAGPHEALVRRLLSVAGAQRIIDALTPVFIGLTVDAVTAPSRSILRSVGLRGPVTQILVIGAAGLALWISRSWLMFQERRLSSELTQTMQHELRVSAYGHLQTLDMAFIDNARTGGLITTIDGDVAELESLLESGLKPFLTIAANTLTAGVAFLVVSPQLAFVQLLVVPVLVWGTVTFVAPARRRYGVVRQQASMFSSTLVGNIEGQGAIRAFTTEERERGRIESSSRELMDANVAATRFVSILEPCLEMGVGLGFLLVLGLGARQVLLGQITAGSFNTLAFMSLRLLGSVAYMGVTVARMQRYVAALERVFTLLDERVTVTSGTHALRRSDVVGTIRFSDVDFSYLGGPPILRKLSLTIPAGQMVAIVGSTGAGKSTLLKLLLRFYDYGDGRIDLDGMDIREIETVDMRRAIAFVGQEVFLFHGTVRDNIAYGRPDASDEEIAEVARLAAVNFIADLPDGYQTIVGERGVKLSGGQRQRIAIARALLTGAPILAMDEATSAVDNETEAAIQRSLRDSVSGKTKIVIAHRLSTIRHADLIYVMDDGTVVEQGRHDDLLAHNGIYAGFWRVQTGERPSG